MEQTILSTFFGKITLLVLIIAIIFFILKEAYTIKLEKRFEPFSLLSNNEHEKSIFDNFLTYLWKLIHKTSKLINKSFFLTNYSKKYERFIKFEEKEVKSSIDYISIKFLTAIGLIFLNLITFIFQLRKFIFISFLLTFLIGFFLPDLVLVLKFHKKQKRIEEDLLKAIIMMNNSFKSGRNIIQAISMVKQELDGPIADEFKKIYLDITYGLSLEVVFNRFYERVKLEDAKYIASSLTLLNKTGGNVVRVFEAIEKSVYSKKKLKNELKSLTAASVFVFRFLVTLPFIFCLLIFILNPTYFLPLFKTNIGVIFLVLIVLLYSTYILVIKKLMKVNI